MKKINKKFGMHNFELDDQAIDAMIQEAMADDIKVIVPKDFADKMETKAKQINLYRFWKNELLKHAALFGGAILMPLIALAIFYYYKPDSLNAIVSFLDQFKWIILAGISIIFAIQLADSWVRNKLRLNS